MKRFFALLLCAALLLALCLPALAEEPMMTEGMMSGAVPMDGGMGAPPDGMPPDGMGGGMDAPPDGGMGGPGGDTASAFLYKVTDTGLEAGEALETVAAQGDVTAQGAANLLVSGTSYSDAIFSVAGGEYRIGGAEKTREATSVFTGETDSYNSVIVLREGDKTGSAGPAASVSGGVLKIDNTYIYAEGSQRYAVNASAGVMAVNDSLFECVGTTANTDDSSAPASNKALLVSGYTRTNMSVGTSRTYYYNSSVLTDGWAAMSTDSATGDGLDFYAYNSYALARDGGYGTYADSGCRDWFYGTVLEGAELGAIISNNGAIHAYSGAEADETVLQYLAEGGATTEAGSVLAGGRNAVQIHSPDMMGEGRAYGQQAVLEVRDSTLSTTTDLVSTCDYAQTYGDAIGAYVDAISGAAILVKSHTADIDLTNVTVASYSDTLLMTVVNSDSMSRWLKTANTDTPVSLTITDSAVSGSVIADDCQRTVAVELVNTQWSGAANFSTLAEWNARWAEYADDENCVWILDEAVYGEDCGVTVALDGNSVWTVTETSRVTGLTLADGAQILCGGITAQADGTLVLQPGTDVWTAEQVSALAAAPAEPEAPAAEAQALNPDPVVSVTSQALAIDGVDTPLAAYNIDGYNYFKLRDLAFLLMDTPAAFNVEYDAASDAIALTPGGAYTPLGTERTAVATPVSVVVSPQTLTVAGAAASPAAYNIDGYNYFKLRDLGELLGFEVDYIEETRTMTISTGAAAAGEQTDDVPADDGTAGQGNTVSGVTQKAPTEQLYNDYVQYLRDYMNGLTDFSGLGDGGMDAGAVSFALSELDNQKYATADLSAFPFEMYVTQFGALTYDAWAAPAAPAADSASEDAYKAYLKAFVASCADIQSAGNAAEFNAAIEAGTYDAFPCVMLFELSPDGAPWFGETAMTYAEFTAAGGNVSVSDHASTGSMLDDAPAA